MTKNIGKLSVDLDGPSIVLKRSFEAPRDLVFEANASDEGVKQWFGPGDWPLAESHMDFRPGGTWHYCMRGPDGQEAWGIATYREIVRPERISYEDAFSDAQRSVVPPVSNTDITLREDGPDRTELEWRSTFASVEDRDRVIEMGMDEGIAMSFDQLEAHLATLGK